METAERPTRAAGAAHRTIDFSYAPSSGWTLICRPDDPLKILVREDGALLYGHEGTYLPMALPGSGAHQFYPGFDDANVPAWRLIRPETAIWALC
jgi:hypothetical protein